MGIGGKLGRFLWIVGLFRGLVRRLVGLFGWFFRRLVGFIGRVIGRLVRFFRIFGRLVWFLGLVRRIVWVVWFFRRLIRLVGIFGGFVGWGFFGRLKRRLRGDVEWLADRSRRFDFNAHSAGRLQRC